MAFIQIRVSDEEKMAAKAVLKSMGMTVSGAVKMFLKQVVNEQKIPFEVKANQNEPIEIKTEPKNNPKEWSPFSGRKIGS